LGADLFLDNDLIFCEFVIITDFDDFLEELFALLKDLCLREERES